MKYSDAIKKLRTYLHLTQTEFGETLGVTFGTVNRWESGIYEPTMKIKRKLAPMFKEYKIEVDE
ncbi:DNA-binding XRE family transcriptional regulator [Metamycoplasma subdolum]|uniref:DNA-binding XRE family transcriptional regulator n=1 Tax=Metamycoplasma subdolum TaxID=92407 RepID=A0A3M0A432_9BACT|nr:helix-turn-helix transcriptional regulator [Metamycoplasma subdolum]RMA79144.1 DNA-binding XRE family transcriptional regulator [Metamycoplasma subdolum]WPB50304.1 helix-turn-helix transcriptional regulator [Metamycoplasma subdolum]